ncbi:MAG: ATP-binding cassette domain-containing protein [archaeon]
MPAIAVHKLTKRFGSLTAVDGIDLCIKTGERFGLLGPNGAGKTTTISMLCTLLKPTSGKAEVCGYDIVLNRDEVRSSIGIVFQDPSLDDQLTAFENLEFHGIIYHMPNDIRRKRINELLSLVELKQKAGVIVKKFSGGMKRRLEIARGLMHHPKVLFLDEPTLGLDPQTRRRIWEYIETLNKKENVTIVLTTHYMDEADYLCDRIAIIDHGKIKILDTPQKLKSSIGGDCINLEAENYTELVNALSRWVTAIKTRDGSISITVNEPEKNLPRIMETAQKTNAVIKSIDIHKPTLEDVFLHVTGKTIRDQEGSAIEAMRLRAR